FASAALTDFLDGLAARALDQRSKLGGYLDPLADKSLVLAAFLLLAWRGVLPPWLAILIVLRDPGIVLFCVLLRFGRGRRPVVHPSILGKAATGAEMVTVTVALAVAAMGGPTSLRVVREVLYASTAALVVGSALQYLHHERRVFRQLVK